MRISILGAGQVGTTLGRGWAAAGHDVVYGSRKPEAGALAIRAAVERADVVVLTTPWAGVEGTLAAAGDFGGRVLVDVTNPIAPGFQLALGHTTSGAEKVASLAKNARVVKAFNTTGVENMANPKYGTHRALMAIAGDDREAVDVVSKLATELGFEAVGLQPLSRARELEPYAMLWIKLAVATQNRSFAVTLARRAAGDEPRAKPAKTKQTVVVVGTGNIGGALARGWLRAGHEVILAVRDAGAGADDVQELVAAGATAVPIARAAERANVVVLAVPAGAVKELAATLGSLAGKVVIDCTNAIGKGFVLEHGLTTSSSEEIAKALPGAHVVRSFNQQGAETLRNPTFSGLPAVNFVAADDAGARARVIDLTTDLGLDAIDAGPLSASRYLEPLTLLWIATSRVLGTREFAFAIVRR